jgi:hypothetical protein
MTCGGIAPSIACVPLSATPGQSLSVRGSVNGRSVNSSPLKNPERSDFQGRSEQSKVFDFAGFGGAEVG